ncbi:MAG: hypothetical protein HYY40_09960 [Bacteroidetes bacterium]|nr:hypothetical protein [Bacteroidota bacterium]
MKNNFYIPTLIFLCGLIFSAVNAQVQLVKDIGNASSILSSNPNNFVNVNGIIYFTADDGVNGTELWKSDGTLSGTAMVKDIYPGSNSSNTASLTNVNGTLFFRAENGLNGIELWKSDGTAAGTVMVSDIDPGATGSLPGGFTAINNIVYFNANEGINGTELWKSDGTSAGTVLVKDINPGIANSGPANLLNANGTLFFRANDGTNGYELWKSDGTTLGTVLIKDIYPGSIASSITNLTNLNGTVLFSATDGTNGTELWKSNGTSIGTVMVKDIASGATNSSPSGIANFNNSVVVFSAYEPGTGTELWSSDGTLAGTVIIKDINTAGSSNPGGFIQVGNIFFFIATEGTSGYELWLSDGTGAGTGLVKDIYPGINGSSIGSFTNFSGILYFAADDGINGKEIWRSDGTSPGTVMIKDVYSGSASSSPQNITAGTGFALFMANDGINGWELWKSDGTTGGTVLLKNIRPDLSDSQIDLLTPLANDVFFQATDWVNGKEIWKSDGTTAGTAMLKDINPGPSGSSIYSIITANNMLFFNAADGTNGDELWKSDGTLNGTVMVKDIVAGAASSSPGWLTNVNDTVFFAADDPNGNELWKSDGTSGGTVLVKDIWPGASGSGPYYLTNSNGVLYCTAQDGTANREPWKSDGTLGGTVMIKDINAGGNCSCAGGYTFMNGETFFFATHPTYGTELWKSDGTSGGTVLVKDIYPGINGGGASGIININGTLFFGASDGINGGELWKSDGTTAGTVMVIDINPGSGNSNPGNLTNVNGALYFTSNDGTNGTELWKSDGTTAGTVMLKDIFPGSFGSSPSYLVSFHDTLFFAATDDIHGKEIWTSAGTAASTAMVADIYSGPASSNPALLTPAGTNLFFAANDGIIGRELWKLTMPPPITDTTVITNISCNGLSDGAIDLTVSGGTSPYTFLWSNAQTTEDISGLSADTFSVAILDSWGWTQADTFIVTEPAVLSVSLSSQKNVTCNGGNDGEINISVSGGTTLYTFAWSNLSATEDVSGLTAGNYSVLITDANNCTQTFSATISQPLPLSGITFPVIVSCNGGSNGLITMVVTVGVPPYTYLWDATAGSQSTQTATGLIAGTYTVTVTDSTNCQKNFTGTVSEPAVYSTTLAITPVNCNGAGNGGVDLSVSGSNPPYTYSWSNGATTQDITNIMAGTYTITITDNKGCTKVDSAIITQPVLLNPNFSHTDVTCNNVCDGTASVNPSGGTQPYIYTWQTSPVQTTQTATGLCPGIYNVNISDNNNCQVTPNVTITEPNVLSVSVSVTDATCNHSDGSVAATPGGGIIPYSYNWSNGNTNAVAVAVGSGSYTVTVTDGNGCDTTGTISVGISAVSQEICLVTVDSLTGKNLIVWEKTYGVGTDHYIIYSEDTSLGLYDSIGIVPFDSLSEFVDVGSTPKVHSDRYGIIAVDSCGNYSAMSVPHKTMHLAVVYNIDGFTRELIWEPYEGFTFGTYSIWRGVSQDSVVYVGSVVSTTTQFSDGDTVSANPGDSLYYIVSVIHPNPLGCNATLKAKKYNSSKSNTAAMEAPSLPIAASATSTDVSCNGGNNGMATVSITGGAPPFTYLWNATPPQTDSTATGLDAGIYYVTITDSKGSSVVDMAIVTEPPAISVNAVVTDANSPGNNDGAIDITVTGGTGSYTYLWSNSEVTEDISGISSGTYTVTVTDANSCTALYTDTVKLITGTGAYDGHPEIKIFPNPFNDRTTIEYSLATESDVAVELFNLITQKNTLLYNGIAAPGTHEFKVNGDRYGLPGGIYLLRFAVNGAVRNMRLVKLM